MHLDTVLTPNVSGSLALRVTSGERVGERGDWSMRRFPFPGHLLSPALSSIPNGGEGVGDASCKPRFLQARSSQRGVALVLTLIMLALITIVAVVFLATTRRNRLATGIQSDRTDAEFAAEAGYQHASGKIMEQILARTNLLAFDFLVSQTNGGGNNFVPPVTNQLRTVNFYLDLNRNRAFDPFFYGDPVWLGVLDKPASPHAPNNKAVARYAYFVQPVGKSLDHNTIHNDTSPNPGYGFLRNQGVGPWELNLAAFLHELDPGIWDYSYSGANLKPAAGGAAFADARSFLNYLHGWPDFPVAAPVPNDALSFLEVHPGAPLNNFPPGSIDIYSDGFNGTVLGADALLTDDDSPAKTARWAGADTTNHLFHIQEFFDHAGQNGGTSNKVTYDFFSSLTNAISRDTNGSLYYKLLAQLGTDTGDEINNRIHLFYADHHAGPGYAPTNFIPWDSSPELKLAFFTNVAQRLFLAQSNEFNAGGTNGLPIYAITEIPVFPTNQYSSALHRILQMAANILDANSTNIYPSVFRPLFGAGPISGVNYIVGYTNDDQVSTLQNWLNSNTNGLPMVIGAKKGFPNFNEFTMRTDMLVSRKVQVTRPSAAAGTRPNGTNVMYMLGISNHFGLEVWNSYNQPYPRAITVTVSNITALTLENGLGIQSNGLFTTASSTNMAPYQWQGGETLGFLQPINTNAVFLNNSAYRFGVNQFDPISTNTYEGILDFPLPYWVLTLSNRMTYLMQEGNRIVDFVLLNADYTVDLHRDLVANQNPYQSIAGASPSLFLLWDTNRAVYNAPTRGILQQIGMANGSIPTTAAEWRDYALAGRGIERDKDSAIGAFRNFLGLGPISAVPFMTNMSLAMQAPFNPAAKLAVVTTWQANDPLVHTHIADLTMSPSNSNRQYYPPSYPSSNVPPASLGMLNVRYSPWGGNPARDWGNDPLSMDFRLKDPGIYSSDD